VICFDCQQPARFEVQGLIVTLGSWYRPLLSVLRTMSALIGRPLPSVGRAILELLVRYFIQCGVRSLAVLLATATGVSF
jgi:hypothetical protein